MIDKELIQKLPFVPTSTPSYLKNKRASKFGPESVRPRVGSYAPVDTIANRRRVITLSDGDDTDC